MAKLPFVGIADNGRGSGSCAPPTVAKNPKIKIKNIFKSLKFARYLFKIKAFIFNYNAKPFSIHQNSLPNATDSDQVSIPSCFPHFFGTPTQVIDNQYSFFIFGCPNAENRWQTVTGCRFPICSGYWWKGHKAKSKTQISKFKTRKPKTNISKTQQSTNI